MSKYTITPLEVGRFPELAKPVLTYMHGFGEVLPVPIVMWAIQGLEGCIIVDTGAGDPQRALEYHRFMEQTESQRPGQALEDIGVSPEDIEVVILTHLHWDHCGNNSLFNRAQFIVQEDEIRYAISPLPVHCVAYETPAIGTRPLWLEAYPRFNIVRGDRQVAPGVSTVHLPGHSPGFQGVLVDTRDGPYVIASDCVPLYENWQGSEHEEHFPPGVHNDLSACYQSFKKLKEIGAKILPGHDMQIFEQSEFP
ncbi:MAG: N-acyl homoserine lactonase family protein [Planctomycetota bacterium]|jgi:glyoxylase-like metal-dependent hydrolase (beta-lactamase superfamily II)